MASTRRLHTNVHTMDEVRRALQLIDSFFKTGPLNNLTATADPLPSDDAGDGYSAGSLWYNTSGNSLWVCEDATVGLADWQNVTGTGGGIASDSFVTLTPDSGGNVVADGPADTLTLVGGTGVTTVGTPGTDTITFNTVDSEINHDALSNFVSNEHIDHTAVTLTLTQTTDETSVTSSGSPLDISASRSWTIGIADNPVLPGTGSVTVPIGTTAQQPGTPVNGMVRYNTTTSEFEFRENGAWVSYDPLPASTSAWSLVLADSPTGWGAQSIGHVIYTNISWAEGRLNVSGGSTGSMNEISAPSTDGSLLICDTSVSGKLMKWGDIDDLTADATPDGAADYVMSYDASAGAHKKVLMNDLPGGGSGAPTTAQYVTMALDGTLSAERVLTGGSGIGLADGGANGNATLSLDINGLTDEPAVQLNADKVAIYDNTATANRKTTVENLWADSTLLFATAIDVEPQGATEPAPGSRGNHRTLDFDDTTEETAVFTGYAPEWYRGGDVVCSIYFTAVATTGNVRWQAEFELLSGQDLDTTGFAAGVAQTQAANGTSGVYSVCNITLTNAQADGIVAGAPFRVRVARVAANAADTMVGDAQVVFVAVKEA